MKKMVIMAALAFSALLTQASITFNFAEGYLYKHDGSTVLPENSTIVLLLDANNNGSFGDLTQATTSWTADAGDVVLDRWAFNYNYDTGFGSDSPSYTYGGDVIAGKQLKLVWYDKTYSAGDAGPGEGVDFGMFRTDSALTGSDTGWFVPADGNTIALSFLTANAGGDSLESAGTANFQTIPEPASAVLALLGAGMVYVVRRNTRRSIYQD